MHALERAWIGSQQVASGAMLVDAKAGGSGLLLGWDLTQETKVNDPTTHKLLEQLDDAMLAAGNLEVAITNFINFGVVADGNGEPLTPGRVREEAHAARNLIVKTLKDAKAYIER